jgi:transcriptional regulator with GAF, ATPase, and Fis domain
MLQPGTVLAIYAVIMMTSLKNKIESIEKEEIMKALRECNNVMAHAARKLGITERMIGYKIKKYKITHEKGDFYVDNS